MHCRAEVLQVMLEADLNEAGFDETRLNRPDTTKRDIVMAALRASLLKKFHNDVTDANRDDAALALFLECNQRCGEYPGVIPRRLDEEYIVGEMKSMLYDFFNPTFFEKRGEDELLTREPHLLNLSDIATYFGLGAGSNIGASSTDFYSKYVTSRMSHCDPALPILFRHALSVDKLWSDVEDFRAKRYGYERVSGNRLSFVPKSRDISRTICTEPLLNMFFQKGIGGVLTNRIYEVFGLDPRVQPDRNARLARIGSITGQYGTIDLSSASDSISIRLLQDILPPEPLSWLMRTRSPVTTLPGGQVVELQMISSMGNGFTFPLQTLIFACLVAAAYKVYDIKLVKPNRHRDGNFAVFGDDIIVDRRVYPAVARCLEILGFSVNSNKSFNTGLFRESCGSDFHAGANVRGVYIKTLRDAMDSYSAINRLIRWSSTHGILLRHTIGYLRLGCRFIGVPYDEADDAGIKVPMSLLRKPKRNTNGAVCYLANVVSPYRVRLPSCDADAEPVISTTGRDRVLLPGFVYNASGVLLCLLAGHLRDGFLGLRTTRRKAVQRRRHHPGWDESIVASGESRSFAERWKFFCEANLVS